MAGVLKGKFGYMSPEQVRGLPLDRRSDIFAIGTMLYECLTGERLFQGETDFSTLEKVRNVDVQAPRAINPAIPEAVEKIILKALAKDVDDRYQWCSEMLADLQAFLMSQDVVFTAKTLSAWLKEQFVPEIERERGLLEQYKRVGRDGLIAGAPSAEAKVDLVENLGEAGEPDGPATMLGGPNFEDMEHGIGAAPDVHQSPAAGGPRGAFSPAGKKPASAPMAAAKASAPASRDDSDSGVSENSGDFGEEAPTEIFGDDPSMLPPPAPAPVRQAPPAAAAKTPAPKAPPGMPPTRAPAPSSAPPLAASGLRSPNSSGGMPAGNAGLAAAAGMGAAPYQQPFGTPQNAPAMPSAPPLATPIGMPTPTPPNPLDEPPPQRTVLGMTAPQGLGNYGGGYRPTGQQAAQPAPNPLGSSPSFSPPYGQPPQQQQPPQPAAHQSYPSYSQPYNYGYQGSQQMGLANQQGPLSGPMAAIATPIEGKKSTLMRDIGIGVGIAALVLIGFLVVKMVVLDDSGKTTAKPASTLATVKLAMPKGMKAEMFVDGTRVGMFENDQSIGIAAGDKHIKLVGSNGLTCDSEHVKLESAKTTTLECGFSAGSGAGSATPSTGSAAATGAAGSSAQVAAADGSASETKATGSASETKATGSASETKATGSASSDTKATGSASETKATTTAPSGTKTQTPSGTSGTKTETTKAVDATKTTTTTKTGAGTTTTTKTGTGSTKTGGAKAGTETKATADDPTKGYLQVFSKPAAKILIDGNDTGFKTPISGNKLALAPGKHKITFVIGDDKFTYPVLIKAGATESITKDLQ